MAQRHDTFLGKSHEDSTRTSSPPLISGPEIYFGSHQRRMEFPPATHPIPLVLDMEEAPGSAS